MQGPAVSTLQQQLCTVAAGAPRHRRIDRSQHANMRGAGCGDTGCRDIEKGVGVTAAMCGRAKQRESREWWPMCPRVVSSSAWAGNTGITTLDQSLPERMGRKCGLDEYFANAALAPCAPGNLHDRLRETLVAPKIRAEQAPGPR